MDAMQESHTGVETTCVDGITRITLSRPPLNVLDIPLMRALAGALASEAVAGQARVVVLQSTGKAFSAGVDVADHTPDRMEEMLGLFHALTGALQTCPVPTVALVKRAALGGGAELATCCDLVLAAERAKFGQPEILLGVFPPVAMVNLPRAIGVRRAAEMIMTGNTVSAMEAERIGLVNRVFPDDSFDEEADAYLGRFAGLSRTSLMETKDAFRAALSLSDPGQAIAMLEDRYLHSLMATHDAREGIAAYLEKRRPVWTHGEPTV
jgi:cyclohexa-1,5-dienecarbonyl-CoA hydratase